jgi:hypothetical protein
LPTSVNYYFAYPLNLDLRGSGSKLRKLVIVVSYRFIELAERYEGPLYFYFDSIGSLQVLPGARDSRPEGTGLDDSVRLEGLANDYFAHDLIDSVQLEGLGDDYFDFTLIDISCFDCVQSTFAASTAYPRQEGLWRGHGGLAPHGRQVLPGARERRSEGGLSYSRTNATLFLLPLHQLRRLHCFIYFDYVGYAEEGFSASATIKWNHLLRLQWHGRRLRRGSTGSEDASAQEPRLRSGAEDASAREPRLRSGSAHPIG